MSRFEAVVGNIGSTRVEHMVKFSSIAALLKGIGG